MAGFSIDPRMVSQLDQIDLPRLMNILLHAEAQRFAIPPANVETNLRVNDPDGGIDARITANAQQSSFVPSGMTVIQYKSGRCDTGDIKTEFQKPGVQRALAAGGNYRMVLSRDVSDPDRQALKEQMETLLTDTGLSKDKGRIIFADTIAEWASDTPQALLFFKVPVGALEPLEGLRRRANFDIEFIRDPKRDAVMEAVSKAICGRDSLAKVRITGVPGVGKTRLVHEALKDQAAQVLYANMPGQVDNTFWSWFRSRPGAHASLVVDNCDEITAQHLEEQCATADGRLRLITISPLRSLNLPASGAGFYEVHPLSDEAIEAIVSKVAPGLPREHKRFIVTASSGFPALAAHAARAAVDHPDGFSAQELRAAPDIQRLFMKYIPEKEVTTAKAIAILDYVGWDGDLAGEGKCVAEFVGVTWPQAQDAADRLWQDGFVEKRGRFRQITPHLLGAALAAEVWRARGVDVLKLVEILPTTRAKRGLLVRLASLGDEESAREVARQLLDDTRMFPDLRSINDEFKSEVLGLLAEATPASGLQALQRIIDELPPEEIRTLNHGRRHVVWTLEKLAWLPETFDGAARLLLVLAEAENEAYGNNATGVWLSLFGTRLGATAAPPAERHRLIKEALDSRSESRQMLAVDACKAALSIHETRSVSGEIQRGRAVPPAWRPRNYQEDKAARSSALDLLVRACDSDNTRVSEKAQHVFGEMQRPLAVAGLLADALAARGRMRIQTYSARREIAQGLESLLYFDTEQLRLADDQVDKIKEAITDLIGTSFEDSLRRWVGKGFHSDWERKDHLGAREPEEEIDDLVRRGVEKPEMLRAQLAWLAGTEADKALWFGKTLGAKDASKAFLADIEAAVRASGIPWLLVGYMGGMAEADRPFVIAKLNEWAAGRPSLAKVILETTMAADLTDSGVSTILKLVSSGALPPAELVGFGFGQRCAELSIGTIHAMIAALLQEQSPATNEGAIHIMMSYLKKHPDALNELKPSIWSVVESIHSYGTATSNHYLADLATHVVGDDPVRAAKAILSLGEDFPHRSDPVMRILTNAAGLKPAEVWAETAGAILRADSNSTRIYVYLSDWFAGHIPPDVLVGWARSQGTQDGPRLVAKLTPVQEPTLSEQARSLIIQFGADDAIGGILVSNILTGAYSGPTSLWLKEKLAAANAWAKDPSPAVAAWARHLCETLSEMIEQSKVEEQEEHLDLQ